MNKLTKEEVLHIAKLANLSLSEKEVVKFQNQLSEILDFVEKNNEVETKNVDPLFNVTGKENIAREDETKPPLSLPEALANSSSIHQGHFKVKAVFEE
jgi:aspartyl-tRNA(Asn)/glutamyl-tRNA(Gln) amidotransferase subunit C